MQLPPDKENELRNASLLLLGEPRRLFLLRMLMLRECTAEELMEASGYGRTGVSRALLTLRNHGFIIERRQQVNHLGAPKTFYRANSEKVRETLRNLTEIIAPDYDPELP